MTNNTYKIAFIVEDFSTLGGIEIVTNHLINFFGEEGVPVWGIIGENNQAYSSPLVNYPSHIKLFTIKNIDDIVETLYRNNITHTIIQTFHLRRSYELIKKLKEKHIKTIFFFHNTPNIYVENFAYNKRCYEKIKDYLRMKYSRKSKYYKFYLNNIVDICDNFLVLSENIVKETKLLIVKNLHHKIDYIYNILPLQFSNKPFIKKKKSIVFAGRLTWYKGCLVSVKALAPLLKEYPDWNFYLLGDGEEYHDIKKFLDENNIKNIHLCGRVNNVYEYLDKSKICLLYSLHEGLPTILLEAGYFNNTLISYKSRGGVPDIIQNGVNGFIVDNTKNLHKKIKFLIENENKMESMAMNNKNIFAKFNPQKVIEKWHSILNLK